MAWLGHALDADTAAPQRFPKGGSGELRRVLNR
jgi:hypothetical protein